MREPYTACLMRQFPPRHSEPRWRDPGAAPFNRLLQVMLRDAAGHEYMPPFDCIRTKEGWVSGTTGKRLQVDVIGWRG